jgi:hypothetical protein
MVWYGGDDVNAGDEMGGLGDWDEWDVVAWAFQR